MRCRWTLLFVLAAAAVAVAEEDLPLFSHQVHRELQDAPRCADCHVAAPDAPAPRLVEATCVSCHDEMPAFRARQPEAGLSVRFSHSAHRPLDCKGCHVARATLDVVDGGPAPAEHDLTVTSRSCVDCHARAASPKAPREQACARCHEREERRVRPESHDAVWRRSHGAAASPPAFAGHGEACTLCHRESACVACHRVERPGDHDGLWRTRLHGAASSWDRARCQACHEPGQCAACHRVEQPANHRGPWASTHGLVARARQDTSCGACHRQRYCDSCHQGAP